MSHCIIYAIAEALRTDRLSMRSVVVCRSVVLISAYPEPDNPNGGFTDQCNLFYMSIRKRDQRKTSAKRETDESPRWGQIKVE